MVNLTMQEIRDRLTTLETKHEERHNQTQETLARIAVAVESIAQHQNKMLHMGEKLDKIDVRCASDHERLMVIEMRIGVIWKIISVIGVSLTGVVVAVFNKHLGL